MKSLFGIALFALLAFSFPLLAQTSGGASLSTQDVGAAGGWVAIALAAVKIVEWWKNRNNPAPSPSPTQPTNPSQPAPDQPTWLVELLTAIAALKSAVDAIRGGPVQMMGPTGATINLADFKAQYDGDGRIVGLSRI